MGSTYTASPCPVSLRGRRGDSDAEHFASKAICNSNWRWQKGQRKHMSWSALSDLCACLVFAQSRIFYYYSFHVHRRELLRCVRFWSVFFINLWICPCCYILRHITRHKENEVKGKSCHVRSSIIPFRIFGFPSSAAKVLIFYLRLYFFPPLVFLLFSSATCGIHFPTLPFPSYSPFSLPTSPPQPLSLFLHFLFTFRVFVLLPIFSGHTLLFFPLPSSPPSLRPLSPLGRSPSFPYLCPLLLPPFTLPTLPFPLTLSYSHALVPSSLFYNLTNPRRVPLTHL